MSKPLIIRVYIVTGFMALAACTGRAGKSVDTLKAATDTAHVSSRSQKMDYCFIRTEANDKDTTAIRLIIKGTEVNGDMLWIPDGKDARRGTLTGTIDGNNKIKAIWAFMQEGLADTLAVEFKLSAQQLLQKPFRVNTSSGRQQLDENADYNLIYSLDNCSKFKSSTKPAL